MSNLEETDQRDETSLPKPAQEDINDDNDSSDKGDIPTDTSETEPTQTPLPTLSPAIDSADQSTPLSMEVHHHGHVHEKKKWKEYVFQFFMLFLAVFCGFLAEYQLEHTIEHNREKQFMVALVKDLESDTAQLNSIKTARIRNMTQIDSAVSFLITQDAYSLPLKQMRNLALGLRNFYQNSGTLDQLKNAGGLRLIRKRNIVDSIAGYDQQVKRMILRDKYESDKSLDYTALVSKMFDGRALAKIYVDTALFKLPVPSLETQVNMKPEYLGEFLNLLLGSRTSYQNNLTFQLILKARAERLILLIKKEYKID